MIPAPGRSVGYRPEEENERGSGRPRVTCMWRMPVSMF